MSSKKIYYLVIVYLLVALSSTTNAKAAILINEFSPSTDPEWVEIYNDGDLEVDLTGYLLEDGNTNISDDLLLTGKVASKGFVVFNHTEGWLNNSGDTLKLYNNASPSAIIDQYTYGAVDSNKSVARIPNGSENWQVTLNITNNSSNPTATPNPTITAAPTSTAIPTSTPVKTNTPTPTATPKPTPTKTATPTSTAEPLETTEPTLEPITTNSLSEVAVTPTSFGKVAGLQTTNNKPIFAVIFIVLGTVFLGYGGYLLYNVKRRADKPYENN